MTAKGFSKQSFLTSMFSSRQQRVGRHQRDHQESAPAVKIPKGLVNKWIKLRTKVDILGRQLEENDQDRDDAYNTPAGQAWSEIDDKLNSLNWNNDERNNASAKAWAVAKRAKIKKPKQQKRNKPLTIKLTLDEKRAIVGFAKDDNMTPAAFALRVILEHLGRY